MKENSASPRVLTQNSSVITRGNSELSHEKRTQVRNETKTMHQQSATEPVTENVLIDQPVRTSNKRNSPELPMNQKLHAIPD